MLISHITFHSWHLCSRKTSVINEEEKNNGYDDDNNNDDNDKMDHEIGCSSGWGALG